MNRAFTSAYFRRIQSGLLFVALLFVAVPVSAQSVDFARKNLFELVDAFEAAYENATDRDTRLLETTVDAWRELVGRKDFCLGQVTLNGQVAQHSLIGPYVRYEADNIVVVTRGIAATWANQAISFNVVQRFRADTGTRIGKDRFTGLYFANPQARPRAIVVKGKWVDTSFKNSFPPMYQLWGLAALTLANGLVKYRVSVVRFVTDKSANNCLD